MSARAAISDAVTLRLWVQAGGRCSYRGCNEYLLEDELTGYSVNLAERAHIVGATTGARSPRGDDALPAPQRNAIENLMLLCRRHHHVIDQLIADHSIDGLRRMKREHEDRIRLLTELQEDAASAVVRVIGGIRGAPVEIPRSAVVAAVRADGHFPRFPLALAGEDLEIDLRALPEDDPDYWTLGERLIRNRAARIRDAQQPILHLSIFALTRIPFLVALGFHLDDKIPVTIHGRQRSGTGDGGWGSDPTASEVTFDVRHVAGPADGPNVAIAVSVTAPIGEHVATVAGASAVYEIVPANADYGRELLDSPGSSRNFAETYNKLLARIETDHAACSAIDLFAAVPIQGAVQLGRAVMRDAQPALRVYDRNADGDFEPVLTLGAREPSVAPT